MAAFERLLRARLVVRSLLPWRRRLLAFGCLIVALFAGVGVLQHQYVHSSFLRSNPRMSTIGFGRLRINRASELRDLQREYNRVIGLLRTALDVSGLRLMADGVGFEPTKDLRPCRFSRPVPSTARPPIRFLAGFSSGITFAALTLAFAARSRLRRRLVKTLQPLGHPSAASWIPLARRRPMPPRRLKPGPFLLV